MNAPLDEVTLESAEHRRAESRGGEATYRMVGMPDRDFAAARR